MEAGGEGEGGRRRRYKSGHREREATDEKVSTTLHHTSPTQRRTILVGSGHVVSVVFPGQDDMPILEFWVGVAGGVVDPLAVLLKGVLEVPVGDTFHLVVVVFFVVLFLFVFLVILLCVKVLLLFFLVLVLWL